MYLGKMKAKKGTGMGPERELWKRKGNSHKAISWFLNRNLQARRARKAIFKVLKGKNLQPKILYSERLSFRIEGEVKNYAEKQRLEEY